MNMFRWKRMAVSTLAILMLLLLVAMSIRKGEYLSLRESRPQIGNVIDANVIQGQPTASTTSSDPRTKCNFNVYSMEELDQTCSASIKRPACIVENLDHLKQSAFVLTKLHQPGGRSIKMFVSSGIDGMSEILIRHGEWEQESVRLALSALAAIPGSALVDVGCNLGVYSLTAANMGYRVVAIDAQYQNALRVRKSAEVNGLTERLDVFWNALSAEPGSVTLHYPKCNLVFGVTMKHLRKDDFEDDPVPVSAIGLDDMTVHNTHLENVRNLVIKVDIEGSEWNVFATAIGTFERFNVAMVLMEWQWTAAYFPERTLFIANFLVSRGYSPYNVKADSYNEPLRVEDRLKWPPDVLWLHEKSGLEEKLRRNVF